MSKDKEYKRLLNAKRWKELRAWKLCKDPLCECCLESGKVVAAVDIHHIKPIETAHSKAEMEFLAYDPNNLKSLCIPCHIQIHKEMGRSTKENHKQRAQEALERWILRHEKK